MKKTLTIEAVHGLYAGELAHAMAQVDDVGLRFKAMDDFDSEAGAEDKAYQVMDGLAVYRIDGPLLSSGNWMTKFLGYSSYEDIRNDMLAMANDPSVQDIMIMTSSPGGSVFGITDASDAIKKVGAIKPIFVYSSKNVASGAYWLASAAGQGKLIGSPESEWGSIGVIVTHFSYEKQLEKDGVGVTVIKSDELKAVGGPYKDLTEKEVEHIRSQVMQYDDLFKQHVQDNRPQVRLSSMKAETFIGSEALRMGLIDKVMAYDEAIDYIKSQRKQTAQVGGYNMKMTSETLRVALDAGKTLEDLGLTQGEVDEILAAVPATEPGESADEGKDQQDPGVAGAEALGEGPGASADELALAVEVASLKTELADLTAKLEASQADAAAGSEMKEIVIGVLNNRRVALGLSALDMSAFSTASVLADYKAVSDQFDKSFKVGGMFQQKEEKRPPQVAQDSVQAGLMQAAA